MNGSGDRTAATSKPSVRAGALLACLVLIAGCVSAPEPTASSASAGPPATSAPATARPSVTATATVSSTSSASGPSWDALPQPVGLPNLELQGVLLGDGRALLMGYDEEHQANVARLWDPSTGAWGTTAALPDPRTSFAAIGLKDGRALVVGGYNEAGKSYSSAYAFDPRTEQWAKVGVMDAARTDPAVAQLADGRVLVAGGYFWQQPDEGDMPGTAAALAAYTVPLAPVPGPTPPPVDDVDVAPHGYALATAELFDPASGMFTTTGPMKYARPGASIVTLRDGRVLVVGASRDDVTGIDDRAFETAEIYDAERGRFEQTDALPDLDRDALEQPGKNQLPDEDPAPVDPGTLAALPDGGALLVAHSAWWKHVGDVSRSFRFDPATASWREIGDTYIYVGEPTSNVLYAPGVPSLQGVLVAPTAYGSVLVAGGGGVVQQAPGGGYYTDSTADARLFDPTADTWSSLPPQPEARQNGVAVTLQDGSVLLVGGWAWLQGIEEPPLPAPARFVPGP